ncbi:hypothetical protein HCB49_14110 [Listeria sp. FSL L7-0123]|uniref:Uncharacterized protein n=1 Tax=Listeria cossartiae subsp. cayugensis TaxID=2713505 RepID=A0A7X0ZEY7_9LIST|nr:hypothetical protein [Listeria cossartiae]MBC2251125.1 hypothetical protein [Listeria cossartiae subsp. cayugensis]
MTNQNVEYPIYYAKSQIEEHQRKMQEEVEEQAGERLVEKEDLLQLIYGELTAIKDALTDFAAGYGQSTEEEQVERMQTFSERLKESFSNFKTKVTQFLHRMDEKLAFKEPVTAKQGTEIALKNYMEDPVGKIDRVPTELETPFAKKEVEKQNQDVREVVQKSMEKGTLDEKKLEKILEEHFQKTEKMVLSHLDKVEALSQTNELPSQQQVDVQRKSFRERMSDSTNQLKDRTSQAIQSTILPVQNKMKEVQDKVQQVTSDKMIALGDKLRVVGLDIAPKVNQENKQENKEEKSSKEIMGKYPDFILGNLPGLPEEISQFDKLHTPAEAVGARIEVMNDWLEHQSSKNYANDKRITSHTAWLTNLSKQSAEEIEKIISGEATKNIERADTMKISAPNKEVLRESLISQKQSEIAKEANILEYLNARGEKFNKNTVGKYQHVELPNLVYSPTSRELTYSVDGEEKVARNAIEAGQMVYGYKEAEVIEDILKNIQKGELQVGDEKQEDPIKEIPQTEKDSNLDPKEVENKQAKEAYINYLAGSVIADTLKSFDKKYGLEEAFNIRMEAIDEEVMFGHKLDRSNPMIENKINELQSVFRERSVEKQTALIREEYRTQPSKQAVEISQDKSMDSLLQSVPNSGPQKEDIIPEYQSFMKASYAGENGQVSDLLTQYEQEHGLEASMQLRLDAVENLLESKEINFTEAEYMEDVKSNLKECLNRGPEAMQKFKENEQEGNVEKNMHRSEEQSPLAKGIR